jgi:hypothetical protein
MTPLSSLRWSWQFSSMCREKISGVGNHERYNHKMRPYKSELSPVLFDGYQARVIVPSAEGIPVASSGGPDVFLMAVDALFVASERIAQEHARIIPVDRCFH